MQRRERDLRGADQEELVALDLVDHLALAGEEPGAVQRSLADEDRRHHRLEALAAHRLDREAGSAPARPSPGRRAGRRSASPRPRRPSRPRSSRARGRGRGGRGARSRSCGRSPTSRSVTASSSPPSGASGCGRFGSVAASASRSPSTSASSACIDLSSAESFFMRSITLASVLAGALGRARSRRRRWFCSRAASLDLGQQLAPARVELEQLVEVAVRARGAPARPGRAPGPRGSRAGRAPCSGSS